MGERGEGRLNLGDKVRVKEGAAGIAACYAGEVCEVMKTHSDLLYRLKRDDGRTFLVWLDEVEAAGVVHDSNLEEELLS